MVGAAAEDQRQILPQPRRRIVRRRLLRRQPMGGHTHTHPVVRNQARDERAPGFQMERKELLGRGAARIHLLLEGRKRCKRCAATPQPEAGEVPATRVKTSHRRGSIGVRRPARGAVCRAVKGVGSTGARGARVGARGRGAGGRAGGRTASCAARSPTLPMSRRLVREAAAIADVARPSRRRWPQRPLRGGTRRGRARPGMASVPCTTRAPARTTKHMHTGKWM